jgi:hypothetical protein
MQEFFFKFELFCPVILNAGHAAYKNQATSQKSLG